MIGRLQQRLDNWGEWTRWENHIGPEPVIAVSIECRHIAELGDVHESEPEPPRIIPDVADAESINGLIQRLGFLERLCISLRYGGVPAVFRMRRISEEVQEQAANNAEILLSEWLRKSA